MTKVGYLSFVGILLVLLVSFTFSIPNNIVIYAMGNSGSKLTNVETHVEDVLNMEGELPDDYLADSTSPHGLEKNEWAIMVKQNELALLKSDNGTSGEIKIYDSLSTGTNTITNSYDLGKKSAVSYVSGVAFNPSGDIKTKCYGAYLGITQYENGYCYILQVIDLRNGSLVARRLLSYANWFVNVPQFNYKNFITLTAGDYDNDNEDEVAVVISADDSIFVNIYDSADLEDYVQYSYLDLLDEEFVRLSNMPRADQNKMYRPITSMTSGDFDGDGIEELAISISSSKGMSNFASRMEEITTNVAILDNPMDTKTVKISKHQIYRLNSTQSDVENIKLLYASQITSGDLDGDGNDEVVLAGYVGDVNRSNGKVSNQFVVDKTKFGLSYIKFLDSGYVTTDIKEIDMNEFIKDGFYYGDDIWNVISIACAKVSGDYESEAIFVSGSIYDYSTSTPVLMYTYDLFKQASERGTNAYVESVTVGNFTNNELYRETFAFTICYKYTGGQYYSYQLGMITGIYDDDLENGKYSGCANFTDNSSSIKGKYEIDEKNGYVAFGEFCGTNFCILATDVDDDGVKVKYVGTDYMYSDPVVKAVLQAAPYFSQLGGRGDFCNTTSYSIQTSYTTESSDSRAWSVGAGFYVEGSADAIFVDTKLRLQISGSFEKSWGSSTSVTNTYTDTFQASVYDTVVLSRIPSVEYKYVVWNNDKKCWDESKFASILVPLRPVYYQLSVEAYNEFVVQYNEIMEDVAGAVLLKPINSEILPKNTDGNPYAYYSQLPSGGELLSPSTYALSHNGGYTTATASKSVSKSTFSSLTGALSASINWSAGVGALFAKVEAGVFIDGSFSRTLGKSIIKSNEYEMSGTINNVTVGNYQDDKEVIGMYKFNWNLAGWDANLTFNSDDVVRVVGYLVHGISTAGNPPAIINAQLDNDRAKVVVSWSVPDAMRDDSILKGYNVYRKKSGRGQLIKINENLITATTFEDDSYRSFLAGVQYEYYVGAVYEKDFQTHTRIALEYCVIVGGVYNENSEWKLISSLSEINANGSYCLKNDIELSEKYTLIYDIVLDLNGYSITNNNNALIEVGNGGLILYDSKAEGKLISNNNNPIIKNSIRGIVQIIGGTFNANNICLVNSGRLIISNGNFVSNKLNIITNDINGELILEGGIFHGSGTDLVTGICNYGKLSIKKVDFRYFLTAIKLYEDSKIDVGTEGITSQNRIAIEIIDKNGESVAGIFSNYVPKISLVVANVFESRIGNSDIYITPLDEFAICVHDYNNGEIEIGVTCTTDGIMTYTCNCCGKIVKQKISALGHNYGDWIPEVSPTENTYGTLAHYHCDRCFVNFDENKEILYTLHIGKSGKGVVSIEKTKTENGMDIFTILYTDGSISTYSVPTSQSQTSYVVFAYIGFALALIALVILLLVFIKKNKDKKKKLIRIKYNN